MIKLYAPTAICMVLMACANHPLQDDVTGYTTYSIVQKLRCEAQAAIIKELNEKSLSQFQSDLQKLNKNLRAYQEWRTIHQTTLAKIDKEVEVFDIRDSSVGVEISQLESVIRELVDEFRGLERIIQDPKVDGKIVPISDETRSRIEARKKIIYDKVGDLNAKWGALNKEKELIKQRRLTVEASKNRDLAKIGATSGAYFPQKRRIDKINRTLKGAPLDPALVKASLSDGDRILMDELFYINRSTMSLKLDFKITENNNATVDGAITWPIHLGALSLGMKSTKEKGRQAQRVVNITSTFEELSDTETLNCARDGGAPKDTRARIYPITGAVGIDELVSQYLKVRKAATFVVASGQDTFTDTLIFTTKLSGRINPTIEIKPVNPSLVKAGIDLTADRTDLHQVAVQIRPFSPPGSSPDTKVEITKLPGLHVEVSKEPTGWDSNDIQH